MVSIEQRVTALEKTVLRYGALAERSGGIHDGLTKIPELLRLAAYETGVTTNEIMSHYRSARIVRIRHAVYWVARHAFPLSLPQIARRLNRDHTTIVYGIKRAENRRISGDPAFVRLTDRLLSHFIAGAEQ